MIAFSPTATGSFFDVCPACGCTCGGTISHYRTEARVVDEYPLVYVANQIPTKKEKEKYIHDYNWDLNCFDVKKTTKMIFVAKRLYHLPRDRI